MPSYSAQFKEQAVRRLMPPNSQTISMVSQDLGIAVPTLYAWKRQFELKGFVVPAKSSSPDQSDMTTAAQCDRARWCPFPGPVGCRNSQQAVRLIQRLRTVCSIPKLKRDKSGFAIQCTMRGILTNVAYL